MKKKKECYRWGGDGPGTFFCAKCGGPHRKLSKKGKSHRKYERRYKK